MVNFKIEWSIEKSLKQQKPGMRMAGFVFCFGIKEIRFPSFPTSSIEITDAALGSSRNST